MISQKKECYMSSFSYGYNIIWYAYDERNFFSIQILKLSSVLMVVVQASLERFTSFLIGLTDVDDSGIFIFFFFEYFSKDSYMAKNVV